MQYYADSYAHYVSVLLYAGFDLFEQSHEPM